MTSFLRHGLYTIPSGTGFLKRLAEGLLSMATHTATEGHDDFVLSRMRVLLPTRRACRELRDAFLQLSGGKPLLLPHMQPIGDIDSEELDLTLTGFGIDTASIPPAISSLERKFLLAHLVQRKDPDLTLDAALSLTDDLARLIDTVHTEDLDFSGLNRIVPDKLATHWLRTLTFLEIVTATWPEILKERGLIDPADRRNRLLKSLATLWTHVPPDYPVIAAGSTGSIPSTGHLLNVISKLPQGVVVLPGFDTKLSHSEWDDITETHPQATMRNLMKRMELTPEDVRIWPESEEHPVSCRAPLLRAIMRPTEHFGFLSRQDAQAGLSQLNIIEAQSMREEAAVIAIALREIMEDTNKTACLVTPDRTLARRVMTALKRWHIDVDDSAGGALATTPSATFLVSILRVVERDFAPLALLEFLKHPCQRVISIDDVVVFEKTMLRGARPASGIQGLYNRLQRIKITPTQEKLEQTVDMLEKGFSPLIHTGENSVTLDIFSENLVQIAEYFMGGSEHFWSQRESDAVSVFISNVIEHAALLPLVSLHLFGNIFRELLSKEKYRSIDEPHRRILILGQIESRLISRDVMILGGLNEGTWPRDVPHDPWMSRPMRRSFGLPPAERSAGLAAHDFVEHSSSPVVIITRSIKSSGTSTVPARWLQKLRTLTMPHINAGFVPNIWDAKNRYLDWAERLDNPDSPKPISAPQPIPCPPVNDRPRTLSATWIEKWIKNPYRVYAEKIIKLKMLKPLDDNVVSAERGNFVHDVFYDFVKQHPQTIPTNAKDIILENARIKLEELEHVAAHWQYWWPRFERIIDWFLNNECEWRLTATPWVLEETGQIDILPDTSVGRPFTVTAKADRIDKFRSEDDHVVAIDYKTGNLPTAKNIKNGTAPQLAIECLILREGGYRHAAMIPQDMCYWKLSGSDAKIAEVKRYTLNINDITDACEQGLKHLVTVFDHETTPYIAKPPVGQKIYDDERAYAHLARCAEWASGDALVDDENEEA